MIKRTSYLLATIILSLSLFPNFSAPAALQSDITFPQTGFTLSDAHGFLTYWQSHGGLAQFGYPISAEEPEVSSTDGKVYLTQWFERNRFEYHPEYAGTPYSVLLGLLGRDLTHGHEAELSFAAAADPHNTTCR